MAKEQQLPFGQITPVAKPLGAFVNPAQKQTAGAAKPSLIGSVPQIATLQRGSQGNVQGYNQFQQLSQALGPFTQNLVKAGASVYENYARTNMQTGFENAPEYKEARNQLAKAKLSLQQQSETGAIDANAAINFLRKTDPEAAALLDVDNPWRLIGRRKYLAKMLGSEIDNKVENYLANNQASLAALKPGSGEIEQAFHGILTGLNDEYGLTGDETEYHAYAVSKINSAKDSFRDSHEKLYNEAVDQSSVETAVTSFGITFKDLLKKGVTVGEGENARQSTVADPYFPFLAAQALTADLDDKLSLLAGDRRTDAMNKVLKQILPTYQRTAIGKKIISKIRSGSNNGLKPGTKEWQEHYNKRPFLADSIPYTLLDMSNKGAKAINDNFEEEQEGIKNFLDIEFLKAGGPFDLDPDSEEGKKAYAEFRELGTKLGYKNINEYMNDQKEEAAKWRTYQDELSEGELNTLKQELRDLAPEDFDGTGYREIIRRIQTASKKKGTVSDLMKILRSREEDLQKRPNIFNSVYNQRLAGLFAKPELKALQPPKGQSSFATFQAQIQQSGSEKAKKVETKTYRKVNKTYNKKLNEWYRDTNNRGRIIPSEDADILLQESFDEWENSDELKNLLAESTKKEKVDVPPDADKIKKDSKTQPVGMVGSENVPDRVVKKYRERAVINASWLYNELDGLNQGKEFSPQLRLFSTRAGTTPERYLLEQLRFYRGPENEYTFDPDGSVRKYLEGVVNNKKSSNQASLTYFNKAMASAVSPGPGDWMLNMMFGGPVNAEPMTTNIGLTQGDNNQRFQSAVALAEKLGAKYPEVVAAQFALESGFGNKPSGTNNFFGLKALPGTKGSLVNTEEDDASGKSKKVKANFINFDSEEKSFKYLIDKWYKDYKSFTGVESGKSVKEVTNLLQQQGYATDPNYAKTLQTLVQEYSIGG